MAAKGKRAVLVIDALDEQTPHPGGAPESIFGAVPEELPDGVVALVSVRLDPEGRAVGIEAGALGLPRCAPIPRFISMTRATMAAASIRLSAITTSSRCFATLPPSLQSASPT
jgi:hypothetical protein